jgi:hypothetical protein
MRGTGAPAGDGRAGGGRARRRGLEQGPGGSAWSEAAAGARAGHGGPPVHPLPHSTRALPPSQLDHEDPAQGLVLPLRFKRSSQSVKIGNGSVEGQEQAEAARVEVGLEPRDEEPSGSRRERRVFLQQANPSRRP